MLLYALKRAVTLVQEYAGGEVEGKIREVCAKPLPRRRIELDYDRMEALAGQKIGHETIENILGWLCYDFVEKRPGGSVVDAPSYMVDEAASATCWRRFSESTATTT